MDTLTVSVVLLWLAVIALGVMLWALSRQVGVLFERVAPMGALVTDAGPAVGDASVSYTHLLLAEMRVSFAPPSGRETPMVRSPSLPLRRVMKLTTPATASEP